MPKQLNIQKARQMGYSDDEIVGYLTKHPELSPIPQPKIQEAKKGNLLTSLLPLLGSLVGGGIGALGGPAGIIAGSAVGSGLGETARQGIVGEDVSGKKILTESALGGLGGGLGVLFGGATKLGRAGLAAKTASKAATSVDDVAKVGTLTKLGKAFKGNVLSPATKKGSLTGVSEAGEKLAMAEGLGLKGSAKGQLGNIDELSKLLYGELDDIAKTTTKTTGSNTVKANFAKYLKSDFIPANTSTYKNYVSVAEEMIPSGKLTLKQLVELKRKVQPLAFAGGATTPKKEVAKALWASVDESINALSKETKSATLNLSALHELVPGLEKGSGEAYSYFGGKISKRPVQAVKDVIGRGLEGAGGAVDKYGLPVKVGTGIALGQAPMSLASSGDVAGGYEALSPEPTPTEDYAVPEVPAGLNITAEQVAVARLMLPEKQADIIEAAYKALEGGKKTKDLTEAQQSRSQAKTMTGQALRMLRSNPNIKTGMFGGPLENLKSKFSVGDPATVQFNTLISGLMANIAKARAGTSFTPNEEAMLKQYAPAVGDSRQQLLTKLEILNSSWED